MPEEPEEPIVLEAMPDDVQATLEARDRALQALGNTAGGLEFVIENVRRWLPGSTVRVAFLGGSTDLHEKIHDAAQQIGNECNLTLDFGHDEAAGTHRMWSVEDTDYTAEIRVSFDQRGFFSLVGTDSISPNLGMPDGPVGGRPGQRSLNLGGFDIELPSAWRGTVRHEFLHALGFHHEHVNLRGPCQEAFRFEDDPGYVPTRNPSGVFISDSAGRRPGIYTYLSGARNFWSKSKVDQNLRPTSGAAVVEGVFDRRSVMLYRFPPLFYRTPNSGCAPDGNGQDLSPGDIEGLRTLYPGDPNAADAVLKDKQATLAGLEAVAAQAEASEAAPAADFALEGLAVAPAADATLLREVLQSLQRQLRDL